MISNNGTAVGGIIGRIVSAKEASEYNLLRTYKNCWFAGEIIANGTASRIGGIAGDSFRNRAIEFENMLFTGKIEFTGTTAPKLGGIFGMNGNDVVSTITMINCVNHNSFFCNQWIRLVGWRFYWKSRQFYYKLLCGR